MIQLRRLLVPTDFSETAGVAMRYGMALAERFGAALHVLHVLQDPFPPQALPTEIYTGSTPALREALEVQARTRLQAVLSQEDRDRLSVTEALVFGAPFLEIVAYARQQEIDLIVIGTHGRGAIAHMLLGSVAERVVRKAPCPVLTVRHPQHEFVSP